MAIYQIFILLLGKMIFFEIIIDIEVRDNNHLNNIIAALRLLLEVSSLERVKG